MRQTTDFVLIQAFIKADSVPALAQAGASLCAQSRLPVTLHRMAWSADLQTIYFYARLVERTVLDEDALSSLAVLFRRVCLDATEVRVSRLECVFDAPGHSRPETPIFPYIVEMDPEAGWMPEISRWYDIEHMPGLAAVPGCIRAMRMINHDHGPLSLACYDLVSTQTLGSPPWLAIRGTAWSDVVRPHFTNTKRTMFVRV
jgi:hypothetical protein